MTVDHLFKSPKDYDAIISLINDTAYIPCYERFLRDDTLRRRKGTFETYYAPCIKEACNILRQKGMLTGLHPDGNNRMLTEQVAALPVEAIEPFYVFDIA